MKIVGLITEYNPFHNGHKYHIEQAKALTGADYVIAVMSGNFVQRGAPAFMPKHLRAAMALDGGCDLVIELPVCYATASAEYFAYGAVSILDNLGCVDAICFGSECGNYTVMEKIAQVLAFEPADFRDLLHLYLKQGMNYPIARQLALKNYFKDDSINQILEEPNNILGIEYIKALISRKTVMKGFTIVRKGTPYHSEDFSGTYGSATAIRSVFSSDVNINWDSLYDYLSNYSLDILNQNYMIRYPIISDDFSLLLRCRLFEETKESLTEYMDINVDIANKIINARNDFLNFTQFSGLLKTKDLTTTRINRCLLHILLNIKNNNFTADTYAHILGFRKESNELFRVIKKHSKIPIITKLSSCDILSEDKQKILAQDIFASNLYENVVSHKFQKPFIHELKQQIVKI